MSQSNATTTQKQLKHKKTLRAELLVKEANSPSSIMDRPSLNLSLAQNSPSLLHDTAKQQQVSKSEQDPKFGTNYLANETADSNSQQKSHDLKGIDDQAKPVKQNSMFYRQNTKVDRQITVK